MKTVNYCFAAPVHQMRFEKNHIYYYKYKDTADSEKCIVLCSEDSQTTLKGVCLKDEMCSSGSGKYMEDWCVNPDVWKEFHGTITLEN